VTKVKLGAQTHALGFYERLGFTAIGDEFDDAGIPHREMVLKL
jgi:ElaA protein